MKLALLFILTVLWNTLAFRIPLHLTEINQLSLKISGSCQQPLVALFDTGSEQFWLGAPDCTGCQRTTPVCVTGKPSTNILKYWTGQVTGNFQRIDLCNITTELLCVSEATGITLGQLDGILGISHFNTRGYVFFSRWFALNYGARPKQIAFSINYNCPQLIINEPLTDKSELVAIWTTNSWKVSIERIFIGDKTLSQTPITSILDSGSSLIGLPEQIYESYFNFVQQLSPSCRKTSSWISCPYVSSERVLGLGSLRFQTESGGIIEVPPEAYSIAQFGQPLKILIAPSKAQIILGIPMFHTYRVEMNFATNELSVSNHKKPLGFYGMGLFLIVYCLGAILTVKLARFISQSYRVSATQGDIMII